MNQDPIRIVIAEDHAIFRNSLVWALQRYEQDLKVVGEAANGLQLVDLVDQVLPDVILTDIQMPVMDGVQAVRIIKEKYSHIKIIALTLLSDSSVVTSLVSVGVNGYLLKNCNIEDLYLAIKRVNDGESYFDKEIAAIISGY